MPTSEWSESNMHVYTSSQDIGLPSFPQWIASQYLVSHGMVTSDTIKVWMFNDNARLHLSHPATLVRWGAKERH